MTDNFNKKAVIAMSGGVDSSVAAALLKEQGYDLIGITMILYCSSKSSNRGCCSFSAAADAKKVADTLGFPHYTLNFKDDFKHYVIDNFIEEYRNGRTPNPCIRCNQFIKFDLLLKKAKELGAEYVATGHYARIPPPLPFIPSELVPSSIEGAEGLGEGNKRCEGFYRLLKGLDRKKDQSYVLYTLTQESLAHTLFPLGDWIKDKVREKAKELGLPVAEKEESQEICFVEDDNYRQFLKEKMPEAAKPGPILDKTGKVVGQHEGIIHYTVGQRKGIGAHAIRKYVVDIDPEKNAIIIGEDRDLLKTGLFASHNNFISGKFPENVIDVSAKVRYNSPDAPAELIPLSGKRVEIKFLKPQRAVTPGQSVVFYLPAGRQGQGEELIGGGIIEGGK